MIWGEHVVVLVEERSELSRLRPVPLHLVIPAFNEQENVAQLFADLERRPELAARASSIVIVDDGSSDLTPLLVSGYDGPLPIELLRFDENQGPGAAFRAGFVVRHALGIDAKTVSSFFRVYRASTLRAAFHRYGDNLIRESGFACKAEILAKLASMGARIVEEPVALDWSRRNGDSKMPVMKTMLAYWRMLFRAHSSAEAAEPVRT